MSTYGDAIRKARVDRELSLREVGAALGVSHVYVGEVERGKRPPFIEEHVPALAQVLGVKPWKLRLWAAQDTGKVDVAGLGAEDIERVLGYVERARRRPARPDG